MNAPRWQHEFMTCGFEAVRGRGGGPGSAPAWPLCRFEFESTGPTTAQHVCGRVWSREALAWLAERARRGVAGDDQVLEVHEREWLRHACRERREWSAEHVDLSWVERELDLAPGDVLRWIGEELERRAACWPRPRPDPLRRPWAALVRGVSVIDGAASCDEVIQSENVEDDHG